MAKRTGSEQGLRERMCKCACGVVGKIFLVNGQMECGHYCKLANRWTMGKLPQQIPVEDVYVLFESTYHIGPG